MPINLPILPAIFVCIGTSFAVSSNIVIFAILGEVNGKVSPSERIGFLFLGLRLDDVFRKHKELFPDSRKRVTAIILFALAAVSMFSIFGFGHSDPNLIR
jgi:hypothetical protein